MKYTIKDLSEGRCAVKNDGILQELREVLGLAFPKQRKIAKGDCTFYFMYSNYTCWSGCSIKPNDILIQSVKDFLEEEWTPQTGEEVLVKNKNSTTWLNRIFLAKIPRTKSPYVCIFGGSEALYSAGKDVTTSSWEEIKRIDSAQTEFTLEEIAKRLQVPIDKLKIKK
jgi:hypothetical protein